MNGDLAWRKAAASVGDGHCVQVAWRKATASMGNGNCVEVAGNAGAILVRDSKDKTGPVLTFTPGEWAAFIGGVRNGEFDRLAPDA
jgi:Domain of unknown function (DUF397)